THPVCMNLHTRRLAVSVCSPSRASYAVCVATATNESMRCLFLVTLAACAAAPAALVTPTVDWQIRILPAADWQGTPDTGWLAQVELHVVGAPVDGTSIEESVVAITAADGNPFRGAAQLAGVVVLPQAAAQDWSAAARAAAIESRFVGTSPTFVCMPNAAAAITT